MRGPSDVGGRSRGRRHETRGTATPPWPGWRRPRNQLAELKNMRASGVLRTRIGEREVYFKSDAELLAAISVLEAELNPQRPRNVTCKGPNK